MAARKNSIDHYKEAARLLEDSGQRRPVCVLCGEETFFIDLLQEKVIGLLPDSARDFNLDLLYGNEVTPEAVLRMARSFPMMSEFRIVIVRDFQNLKGGDESEGDLNDLIPYVESPNPSTLLVLIDENTPDKRTRLGKALTSRSADQIYYREFKKLPDFKVPDWIADWAIYRHKKKLDPRATQLLFQLVGNDLQLLSTEIDKVCTFVDRREQIKLDDVKRITGSYREYSVIELKEAVIRRDLKQSLQIMEQMLLKSNQDTGEVIRTVGFFYSVFSNIWQIRRLIEKGMDKSSVQKELGIHNSWYFEQLWKDSSRFQLSEMPEIFEALMDADMAAKGYGTLDTSTILLLLIKRIAA